MSRGGGKGRGSEKTRIGTTKQRARIREREKKRMVYGLERMETLGCQKTELAKNGGQNGH